MSSTIIDRALQLYGTLDQVGKLAYDNNLSLSQMPPEKLIVDNTIGNNVVKKFFSESGIIPNNALIKKTLYIESTFGAYYSRITMQNPNFGFGEWGMFSITNVYNALGSTAIPYVNFGENGFAGVLGGVIDIATYDFFGLNEMCLYSFGMLYVRPELNHASVGTAHGVGFNTRLQYNGTGIPPAIVTDDQGNDYDVIKVGDLYITRQNFRGTTLNNGTPIGFIDNKTDWATFDPCYTWFNYDINNINKK